MFLCVRGKNRCSHSFRLGFLILATNTPMLLLWPTQDWKRDEGTEGGRDGRAAGQSKVWFCSVVTWQERGVSTSGSVKCALQQAVFAL